MSHFQLKSNSNDFNENSHNPKVASSNLARATNMTAVPADSKRPLPSGRFCLWLMYGVSLPASVHRVGVRVHADRPTKCCVERAWDNNASSVARHPPL